MTQILTPQLTEHPFAQYVRILGKGPKGSRSFTEEEAFAAMGMVLRGELEPVQLGAFLLLLRVKSETPEELAGFARAVRSHIRLPEQPMSVDLDWSSYAGKRRNLPWFVLSILLLNSYGIRIFMHGTEGHTSGRIYTRNVLQALGLPVCNNWEQVSNAIEQGGFAYMPLETLCPELQQVIDLRNTLGVRSPVHSLVRLMNPLNAPHVIQSIFHPAYQPVHQLAGKLLGYTNVSVIKGDGGEIERNPDNPLQVRAVLGDELVEEEWPPLFERRHLKPASLELDGLIGLWRGTQSDEYGERAATSTAAIVLKQMGKANTQQEALDLASQLWRQRDKNRL
ncbi:glycosyl transferase family protein [Aestuariirhabdus litorea]|uniref:Glycosyl transferase family protein n=1 Tax=Aestuariirhabdus litorea TaxID=2528527 RepID=A0A3P3VQP8_9GAMM|nr:glycosyl transferase family protein [Aestuariirhabdus litorea]RRJ84784.1 glycosyl transferase family protein [Aestuariirhabdus litorea]RWW98008.1 glycosyl transferase family protein [Endozoicomonadaceae bacterium GTF-13]